MISRVYISRMKEQKKQIFTAHFYHDECFMFEWRNKITKRDIIPIAKLDDMMYKIWKEEK